MEKQLYVCAICGARHEWSDDDMQAKMEREPFAPCGDNWSRQGWHGPAVVSGADAVVRRVMSAPIAKRQQEDW